ncbi:MFS 1 and/or Sugar tr domain containing protein [Asbolus verrucosus]|uniref:MFS 1 and/or Sugar tr domain containing protein n=1 Tax=Asbolus verrucosus TaxID=1661398 RepID=A0A482VJR6_ASBVE|nr:MFS 1 and/or Sugar tr domain containing protein [Asbolus verrucosus]
MTLRTKREVALSVEKLDEIPIFPGFLVPQRYIMVLMSSCALFVAFAARTAVQISLMEMREEKNASSNSEEIILTSFYWGYIITHLPGGILSEYYGAKHLLGLGVLASSIIAVITPQTLHSSQLLMASRVVQGLFQGVVYPAANALLGQWIPKNERSSMASITFAGAQLGIASAFLVGGNRSFYIFGGIGIIWWIAWQFLCYSSPETHPFIKDAEKEYLREELVGVSFKKKKIPWDKMFSSSLVWAAVGAEIGHNWCWFVLVTELPRYLESVLKFNVRQNELVSSMPFLCMWLMSIITGFLGDVLISRKHLTVTRTRKIFTTIGYAGSSALLLAAVGHSRTKFLALFVVGLGLMSAYNSGTKPIILDFAPNLAGVVMGIVNGFGHLVSIMMPIITLFLNPDQVLFQWKNAFCVSFLVSAFANAVFVVFASAEEEPWNSAE